MHNKRPPRPGTYFPGGGLPTIRDGGGGIERERLSRPRMRETPETPDVESGRANRVADAGGGYARRYGIGSEARIEEAEDESLQPVGPRRRVRAELVAVGLGALFVAAMLVKPWTFGGPRDAASRPPAAASAEAVAAATATSAQSAEPEGEGLGVPTVVGVDPPSSRVLVVDFSHLLAGDRHPDWGIATAFVAPRTGNQYLTPPVAPSFTWRAADVRAAEPLVVRFPRGRLYALAVTWPASVRPAAISFMYLGTGPGLATVVGNDPFVPIRMVDAVTGGTSPDPGAAEPTSGTFWLPPSVEPLGELWTPTLWFRGTLSAGWPTGDYLIRLDTQSGTFELALRLERE